MSQTNEIMWSDCNAHLLTFSDVSEEKYWPIKVNAEDLEEKLPQLEKAEQRLREEEKLKEQEKEKKENGSARGYDSTSPKRSPW